MGHLHLQTNVPNLLHSFEIREHKCAQKYQLPTVNKTPGLGNHVSFNPVPDLTIHVNIISLVNQGTLQRFTSAFF